LLAPFHEECLGVAAESSLIALGAIVAMKSLSNKISNEFNLVGSSL
jgi:hypothetical protein